MRSTAGMLLVLATAAAAASPGLAQSKSTKDIPPPIEITGTARRTDVRTLAGGDLIIQYNNPDRQDEPTAQPTPSRIRIFVPGNHRRIRAILFDLGSTFTSDNTELQAVAREEGWAIIGCLLRYKYGTELLDMALEEAAAKAERPELVNAPIFLAGFSRNGSRAWDFAEEERNHSRTAGLILGGNPGITSGMVSREGAWNEPRVTLARKVPALTVVGSRDPFVDYDKGEARFWHNATYPKIRSVPDVTWGMMIGWGYGHGWEGSWTPFTVFMQDVLALRLDGPAAADGTTRMQPIRFADGWFAEYGWTTDWPEIAPVGRFAGDSSRAVWLPSADLAHVWRAYQVQQPKVAVAVDDGVLRGTAPADATAVEFFDRGRSLGTVRSAPFSLPVKLQGVQTVFAVATTPSGKTPSRPVTVVNGRPLDWQRGTAAEKAAALPENIVVISAAGRATARALLSGQPAQPAAVAALRAELEPLATSAHVEQRDAAAKLLAAMNAAAAQPARPNAGALFDVRVMGAVGHGKALDGPVVQRAIDAAAAAGGRRLRPTGRRKMAMHNNPNSGDNVDDDDDASRFLMATDSPEELAAARRLASETTPEPLSPAALADVYGVSLETLPTNLPREQAEARLRDVISRKDAPLHARQNAACLLWLMDPAQGQESLLRMLREGPQKEKQMLLLQLSFLDKETPIAESPALAAELLALMADEELGQGAVNTCGHLRPPGITEALWQALPRSVGDTRSEVLFWLARLDPGRKSLDACAAALPAQQDTARSRCLTAITMFFLHGETEFAQEAAELVATELLRQISVGDTGILRFPQYQCVEVLRHGNGPQVRKLAEAVGQSSEDRFLRLNAYLARRRWEGAARKGAVLAGLESPEQFDFALAAITRFYGRTGDEAIADALIRASRERPGVRDQVELGRALLAVGGDRFAAEVRAIAGRVPAREGSKLLMQLERKPPLEIAKQLAEAGFLAAERIPEIIAAATKRAEESATEDGAQPVGVLELLDAAGLVLSFDVEADEIPVRHDRLIADFAEVSRGAFRPEACSETMLPENAEDSEAPYRVQFIHGVRLHRIQVRNFGDWFDVERVVRACNRALADAGERRRFIPLPSDGQWASFVCFTPEQVAFLRDSFHVSFDDALDAAIRSGKESEDRVRHTIEQK